MQVVQASRILQSFCCMTEFGPERKVENSQAEATLLPVVMFFVVRFLRKRMLRYYRSLCEEFQMSAH